MNAENALKMLSAIDDFHLRSSLKGETERHLFIFTMTPFGVEGEKATGGLLSHSSKVAGTYALNFIEIIKSIARRRQASFRSIYHRHTRYDGKISISIPNGTATIVKENEVLKFFFKDKDFFHKLHKKILSISQYALEEHPNFLLLRMPRFSPTDSGVDHAEMLSSVIPELVKINRLPISSANSEVEFLAVAKIAQLFRLYDRVDRDGERAYNDIANKLQQRAEALGASLCHGDFWIDNVMQSTNGYQLIDFDKSVYFTRAYDYVHFFLVSRLSRDRVPLERFVKNFEAYEQKVISFLEGIEGIDIAQISSDRIKTSMGLYALIKLTERDLRTGNVGKSIHLLDNLLEAL